MWKRAKLTLDPSVRTLCRRPYPRHKTGCPNYGIRETCPPKAPLINEVLDLSQPVYAIWNVFDFEAHVKRMRKAHPNWSQRQTECCLYWQPKARKRLKIMIKAFKRKYPKLRVIDCPEAMGVDVTDTMKSIGVRLQWPPTTKTYQVAVAGTPYVS